jgi:hypothetical protein
MGPAPLRRRDFVFGAVVGAGGLLAGGLAALGPGQAADRLSHAAFAAQVGTTFRFRSPIGERTDMELVEATVIPVTSREHARHVRRTPFAALFRAEADGELPQDTYRVTHPAMGTFDLLVVPVGPGGGQYEAVFS